MHSRLPFFALAFALLTAGAIAADKPEPKQATPEEIKARLADHALKKAAETKTADVKPAPKKDAATPASTNSPPAPAEKDTVATVAPAPAVPEPPTVLPKVDVRKDRITELDLKLEKQNAEIAREKKNTKPTPLDDTLNGAKVSKALSIFGGQSSDDRATVAKERVAMMEEEKDLIQAISQAQTKEEKEELQKTLDSMRAMRRELEASLR